MTDLIIDIYKNKKSEHIYGATFKETKKYLHIDVNGSSKHVKNFGHALLKLTGERFYLSSVTVTAVDSFGNIHEKHEHGLSNLITKIPKILFAYTESRHALVECCQQYF